MICGIVQHGLVGRQILGHHHRGDDDEVLHMYTAGGLDFSVLFIVDGSRVSGRSRKRNATSVGTIAATAALLKA